MPGARANSVVTGAGRNICGTLLPYPSLSTAAHDQKETTAPSFSQFSGNTDSSSANLCLLVFMGSMISLLPLRWVKNANKRFLGSFPLRDELWLQSSEGSTGQECPKWLTEGSMLWKVQDGGRWCWLKPGIQVGLSIKAL